MVVITSGATLVAIVMENDCVAVCAETEESFTVTAKFEVPAVVGVPEIVPLVAEMESPAGRVPVEMLQE